MKLLGYIDDGITAFINFNMNLEGLARFYVPVSELGLLLIIIFYGYNMFREQT